MTSDIHPAMPQSFDRARRISVVIVLMFDIAFWASVAFLAAVPVVIVFFLPDLAALFAEEWAKHSSLPLTDFSIGRRLLLTGVFLIAMAPNLFLLFHGRRLFAGFARGAVFTEATIAHLKALGFWLIVSAVLGMVAQMFFFAIAEVRDPKFDMQITSLLYGAMTYVAAYVMAEARHIAADNAEII